MASNFRRVPLLNAGSPHEIGQATREFAGSPANLRWSWARCRASTQASRRWCSSPVVGPASASTQAHCLSRLHRPAVASQLSPALGPTSCQYSQVPEVVHRPPVDHEASVALAGQRQKILWITIPPAPGPVGTRRYTGNRGAKAEPGTPPPRPEADHHAKPLPPNTFGHTSANARGGPPDFHTTGEGGQGGLVAHRLSTGVVMGVE